MLGLVAVLLLQDPAAGQAFDVGGRTVTVRRAEGLPLVEDEYTKVFRFDSAGNPKLKALREKYGLEKVVAAGKDEFDRQLLLLDWVHRKFPKFGRPSADPKGALEILKAADEGHTFFCAHMATALVSSAASLGWVDRNLALCRPASLGEGAREHTITEIWSNQHRKWIMLDPTFSLHFEKGGVPLNAWEIRQEWFQAQGKDLVAVLGSDRKRVRATELPVVVGRYPGFGDLTLNASAMHQYAFLGYIPNTDLMDSGPDYGKMFITQDKFCEGTTWHKRKNPAAPAREPYFPVGQAAVRLKAGKEALAVSLRTLTPNLRSFQVRFDDGAWKDVPAEFEWPLKPGLNRLEVRTVNAFGVEGPPSAVELEAK